MAEKILMNCPYCGSPHNTLVQKDGQDQLFRCESCDQLWEYKKSGEVVNPEIKRCENCGQINGPGAKICQNCGHPIRQECPNCGRLIDLDAIFCPYCEINVQEFLEDREQLRIETEKADRLSRLQRLKNEINALGADISHKEREIGQSQREVGLLKKSGKRLYFLGNIGLSDEENDVYSRVRESSGCWTKIIAVTAGLVSWQLFIAIIGKGYNNFEPTTFFQNESSSTLYLICGLSLIFAAVVARLVYCVILLFGRQSRADSLASEEERRLSKLIKEKQEMQRKIENLKQELSFLEEKPV